MSAYSVDLTRLNDPRCVQPRDAWMGKLQGLFDGRPVEGVFNLDGYESVATSNMMENPRQWLDEVLADVAAHADLALDQQVFRPLIVRTRMYTVHFINAILGADVYDLDGQCNWQANVLKTPVGQLQPPDLENNVTWSKARAIALDFVSRGVSLPLYEMPTLSSPLNIALNLYGGEFLVAMLDNPAAARHDLRVITDLIVTLHRWYMAHVPLAATSVGGVAAPLQTAGFWADLRMQHPRDLG